MKKARVKFTTPRKYANNELFFSLRRLNYEIQYYFNMSVKIVDL